MFSSVTCRFPSAALLTNLACAALDIIRGTVPTAAFGPRVPAFRYRVCAGFGLRNRNTTPLSFLLVWLVADGPIHPHMHMSVPLPTHPESNYALLVLRRRPAILVRAVTVLPASRLESLEA